jgi:hypothetical protein
VKDELGYVTGIYLESDGAIAPGWHHLVIQIQGDTLAYWIDGVNVYTVSGSRVVCDHSGGELLLGHDPSAHAHGGHGRLPRFTTGRLAQSSLKGWLANEYIYFCLR